MELLTIKYNTLLTDEKKHQEHRYIPGYCLPGDSVADLCH